MKSRNLEPSSPWWRHSLLACLCLLLPSVGQAAFKDSLSAREVRAGNCNVKSLSIEFRIEASYDQPVVTSRLRWTAGANTPPDCLSDKTQFWVEATNDDGVTRYIKFVPGKVSAGTSYSTGASISPGWDRLFCERPTDRADCADEQRARQLLDDSFRYSGVTVVAERRGLDNLDLDARGGNRARSKLSTQNLDDMLSSAVSGSRNDETLDIGFALSNKPSPAPARKPGQTQSEARARAAMEQVVSLVSSSLAVYEVPAQQCESPRRVSQWVQVGGECGINLRRESRHNFLCANDKKPREIVTTNIASLDLRFDMADMEVVHQNDGWAALVIALSADFNEHIEAKAQSNRWQFTADIKNTSQLEGLSRNLQTLISHCSSLAQ